MRRTTTMLLATAAVGALLVSPAEAATSTATARPSACTLAPLPSSPALTTLRSELAKAPEHPVTLYAMGSSTTYGMDLADPSQRWTDRLMVGLHKRGIDARPDSVSPLSIAALTHRANGALMVNAAVPGAQAETYLAEDLPGLVLMRSTGDAPDIVLHMIGSNDYYTQLPPVLLAATMQVTIAVLDAQPNPPIHVIISTFEDPDTPNGPIPWSAYSAQMKQIASEDPTHRLYIDLAPWFHAVDVPGSDPDGYLDSGGVHPSSAGHQMIADLLLRALGYGC